MGRWGERGVARLIGFNVILFFVRAQLLLNRDEVEKRVCFWR